MRAGVAQGALISPVLFSFYVNDMPTRSHHVELALYADDTAIIATSRKPTLLVGYLESYLNDLQPRLSEWRITINVSKSTAIISARSKRRFIQPRPVTLWGASPMSRHNSLSGSDPRYTAHLNKRSDLSIRNGVMLHKQLIRPMMDYACPAWRYAARTHVRRLQVLQS